MPSGPSASPPSAREVAFTQPFATSSLAIASRPEQSLLARIRPFLTKAFFSAIVALLFVLSLVGSLMWLVERKKNEEHFPKHPLRGIGNGIWFALVTMTTVGYGDRAPVTTAGRVIAGVWMLVALITVSSLTAGIATALTLSQLGPSTVGNADELHGQRVAVVRGTTSEDFATKSGAVVLRCKDVEEAAGKVAQKKAEAVVFDRPALLHYLSDHPEKELHLADRRYQERGYGFAVAKDSPLRARLDVALLSLRETGRLQSLSDSKP